MNTSYKGDIGHIERPGGDLKGLPMNEARVRRLVEKAIQEFELDLSELVVLTEAATGYYQLTPLIAALAGASRVLALTRDSQFGQASDVRDATLALARRWGVEGRIEVLVSREDDLIGQADIVTNLGFVRPIDAVFLRRLKPTAVIPLMWETWEYRSEDIDLSECRRLGIGVLGTNEHHPGLRTFEYIGHIALKLLFGLELEVFQGRIVVIGSGEFAEAVMRTLDAAGASVTLLDPGVETSLKSRVTQHVIAEAEALVIVEHSTRRTLIGPGGDLSASELYELNPRLVIAHICGGVDRASLVAVGFPCKPDRFAPAGHMSVATDYVGPKPLINLHTAGLKVGEHMARARGQGLSTKEAESVVLKETSLAQAFST